MPTRQNLSRLVAACQVWRLVTGPCCPGSTAQWSGRTRTGSGVRVSRAGTTTLAVLASQCATLCPCYKYCNRGGITGITEDSQKSRKRLSWKGTGRGITAIASFLFSFSLECHVSPVRSQIHQTFRRACFDFQANHFTTNMERTCITIFFRGNTSSIPSVRSLSLVLLGPSCYHCIIFTLAVTHNTTTHSTTFLPRTHLLSGTHVHCGRWRSCQQDIAAQKS